MARKHQPESWFFVLEGPIFPLFIRKTQKQCKARCYGWTEDEKLLHSAELTSIRRPNLQGKIH